MVSSPFYSINDVFFNFRVMITHYLKSITILYQFQLRIIEIYFDINWSRKSLIKSNDIGNDELLLLLCSIID